MIVILKYYCITNNKQQFGVECRHSHSLSRIFANTAPHHIVTPPSLTGRRRGVRRVQAAAPSPRYVLAMLPYQLATLLACFCSPLALVLSSTNTTNSQTYIHITYIRSLPTSSLLNRAMSNLSSYHSNSWSNLQILAYFFFCIFLLNFITSIVSSNHNVHSIIFFIYLFWNSVLSSFSFSL